MPRRVVERNKNGLNNIAEAGTNAKNPHALVEEANQRNALVPVSSLPPELVHLVFVYIKDAVTLKPKEKYGINGAS